jgi:site-specific DNA-methyltransferase (adenine-specific)
MANQPYTHSKRKQGTETSSFGTSGRVNHDSTKFYNSRLYEGLNNSKKVKFVENEIPKKYLNKIFYKSSEKMDELPDNSVHLMITSPPYRVLVPGGRACINVANLGRKPYIPLHSYIIEGMQKIGFFMRGEILWNKASSASPSTAWGSWLSASNPVLRDIHEYILVFSKDSFSRKKGKKENTIKKKEFLEWTKSIWTFPAVSAKKIGHPAPFPEELPHRLIQLYSFKDDVILDPFVGSGTACLSALKDGRNYVAYDNDQDYIELAKNRISTYRNKLDIFEYIEK